MVKDMTKGPILSTLVTFTIPLILGNLLQLTYNAVDSIIVGQYAGSLALAAVGTSNPLMTLVLLFTNGICLGAGILTSYLYGAKKYDTLKRQASTGFVAGSVFSILCSILIILFSSPILRLLQVDHSILSMSTTYLRIIMIGLVFSYIYNYLASLLRAMGDSRSPLYFLGISAILNIIGDLFFVILLKMNVEGVAISTVISEALAALVCWIYVYKKIPILRLQKEWLIFDTTLFKKIISYGIVSALQQSAVQVGKLGIQAFVNTMGVATTAAFNAVNRFDDIAIVPEQNMAHATTSVMAQNFGAKKKERAMKAFYYGLILEVIYGIGIGFILYFCATPIMRLFTKDSEVIKEGISYLHLIAYMYILPGITNGIQGYFRGVGDLKITLISSLINIIGRVVSCYILVFHYHIGFIAVPYSYMIGWFVMILFEVPYLIWYIKTDKNHF